MQNFLIANVRQRTDAASIHLHRVNFAAAFSRVGGIYGACVKEPKRFGFGKSYKGQDMKRLCGVLAGILLFGGAAAQQVNPDTLVKSVTNDVLNSVSKNRDIQHGNTAKAIELVNDKVSPAFDFQRMTSLAMGKSWRAANAEQKLVLTEEFKTLLVSTYSVALTSYKNQTIDFNLTKVAVDETDVIVRSSIKQPGNKSISMNYSMEKVGGSWKVYDIVVDGISLVMNFRSQFEQDIHNGGIDGLIKSLQMKNSSKAGSMAKK